MFPELALRLWGNKVQTAGDKKVECISLSSAIQMMGPRKKATKLQSVVGSGGGELSWRVSEPKDYINELSHEVLCHIFR